MILPEDIIDQMYYALCGVQLTNKIEKEKIIQKEEVEKFNIPKNCEFHLTEVNYLNFIFPKAN